MSYYKNTNIGDQKPQRTVSGSQRPQEGGKYIAQTKPMPEPPLFNKDGDFANVIAKEAENVAENINKEKIENKKFNKNTQIRKFYDEMVRLQQQTNENGIDFEKIKPAVYMVVSKCAYARGRELVGPYFYEFIKKNIQAIVKEEDMNKCILFMEAVIGYYRMLNPKENN
jgi:CRISPR-associated protein Csm2